MDIKVEHLHENQKFIIRLGEEEAQLLYRELPDGNLDFYSTQVPDAGRGKGIAKMLVDAGVEFAKVESKKIKPSCSYVERYFEKNPELNSLIAK